MPDDRPVRDPLPYRDRLSAAQRAATAAGHATADFTIVAAGPNAVSPHHGTSDRPTAAGEPVVMEIGGTMPSGYRCDSTRCYVAGGPPPPESNAGYDPAFLHRTGHGIGLDGRHGARIEDIVVCTTDGVERLNAIPTELTLL